MLFTPPRVFLTLARALILSAVVVGLIEYFSKLSDLQIFINPVDPGLVKPDNYHPF
jgi:hypothetical protein